MARLFTDCTGSDVDDDGLAGDVLDDGGLALLAGDLLKEGGLDLLVGDLLDDVGLVLLAGDLLEEGGVVLLAISSSSELSRNLFFASLRIAFLSNSFFTPISLSSSLVRSAMCSRVISSSAKIGFSLSSFSDSSMSATSSSSSLTAVSVLDVTGAAASFLGSFLDAFLTTVFLSSVSSLFWI